MEGGEAKAEITEVTLVRRHCKEMGSPERPGHTREAHAVSMKSGVRLLVTCKSWEKDLSGTKVKSCGREHTFTGRADFMLGIKEAKPRGQCMGEK